MRIGVFWDLDNIKDEISLNFIEKLLDSWKKSNSLFFSAAYGDKKYLADTLIDRLDKLEVEFSNTQFGKKNVTDQVLITEVFSKLIDENINNAKILLKKQVMDNEYKDLFNNIIQLIQIRKN